jgi:hypothetical protein
MFTVAGRPVILRVRFGVHPMMERWGPKNSHLANMHIPDQPRLPLSTNFVLGRQFDSVDPATNAGMHLFEINYFDHWPSSAQRDQLVQDLSSVYAVSNA